MATLSAAIMAHPSREDMVTDLRARLDREVPVVWDRVNDRHDTGIRAVEAYDPTCTHHLVLQDDALPCRDLIAGAEQAVAATPGDVPVSLYIGRVKPFRRVIEAAVAEAGDARWMTMAGIYWGPAVIIPTAHIDDLADWYRASRVANYDRRLSVWYRSRTSTCWYTWPSLVDHRGAKSLVRNVTSERRAHRFLGADRSALDVDWAGPVHRVPGSERLDARRQKLAPT